MVGRRSAKKRGWPPNLYEKKGYYSWRHPETGKWYGLGRDKAAAFREAIEANIHLAGGTGKVRLIDRVTGEGDRSVSAWCDKFETILDERDDLEASTKASFRQRLKTVRERLGDMAMSRVTTLEVANFLDTWESAGKKRMAQAMRSFLSEFFRRAMAKGWISANPVEPTDAPRVQIQRARLTLEQFLAIHKIATRDGPSWLPLAMELALVTGQRREEIRELGPLDTHDGRLWVVPRKTKKHAVKISIPLDLRLQAVNWSVGEVIQRCRSKHILTRHFIHHTARAGRAAPGSRVRAPTISDEFAQARDKAVAEGLITLPAGKTPPSFHEIRSLAERLYSAEGIDTQALLGHKSPTMTAKYHDARGDEWVEVKLR
jgi:integrase